MYVEPISFQLKEIAYSEFDIILTFNFWYNFMNNAYFEIAADITLFLIFLHI